MQNFIKVLQKLDFKICGVFVLDVHFILDAQKYLAGSLTTLSVMMNLPIPYVNILLKLNLLSEKTRQKVDDLLDLDEDVLLSDVKRSMWTKKYNNFTEAFNTVLKNYNLVHFLTLNIAEEESIMDIRLYIDNIMNYGEDEDIKERDFEELFENEDS